jgi:hypothetical protein
VLRKTGSPYLWLGLLLLLPLSAATARIPSSSTNSVSVAVYNDADAPVHLVVEAETIATRVFEQAGVNVRWINCPVVPRDLPDAAICRKAVFPTYFQLRIVPPHPGLSESSFGVSYMSPEGIGCYSYVFYQRVARQHLDNEQNAAVLLGHIMAHEIAHLLLGTNSHSASGIMRAHWYLQELASANKRELLFTPDQARAMTERLHESNQIAENISRLGTKETRISGKSEK